MARKADTISYKEFNKLTEQGEKDHLVKEVLFDDENITQLEETLMGMEYDAEDADELLEEDDDDLDEYNEEDEDSSDIEADLFDEVDESIYYQKELKEKHPPGN